MATTTDIEDVKELIMWARAEGICLTEVHVNDTSVCLQDPQVFQPAPLAEEDGDKKPRPQNIYDETLARVRMRGDQ